LIEEYHNISESYWGAGIGAALGAGAAGVSWFLSRKKYKKALESCGGDPECEELVKKEMKRSTLGHLAGGALAALGGGLAGNYVSSKNRNQQLLLAKNYAASIIDKSMEGSENEKGIDPGIKSNIISRIPEDVLLSGNNDLIYNATVNAIREFYGDAGRMFEKMFK